MNLKHILDGYKVLDFTHALAGPTATRLMAEMGADIVKVELPPVGDMSRLLPIKLNGRTSYFVQQNRGKKSICLNLKTPEGKAIIHDLVKQVDVVVENFSPGVAERLGVGWETVKALNPRAVMCSISALGQQGPLSELPGFDYIAQAYAGITGMIGEPNGPPSLPMIGLGDVNTGVHAACAIGFALLHRERTGEGQYLDISLLDSYFHCHEINVAMYSMTGKSPTRAGHHHFAVCPLGLYKAKDSYICIIALDHQWPSLCEAMGRPELVTDDRYKTNALRCTRVPEVVAIVQGWVDSMPDAHAVLAALEHHRVPCAPVLTIEQVCTHPHMLERGTVRKISDPKLGELSVPGMPLRFSGFPNNIPLEAAYTGQHNEQVLSEMLGYDAARIKALRETGILHENQDT